MRYLTTAASSPEVRAAMRAGDLVLLTVPYGGRNPEDYPVWAADNGCFGKGYPGDEGYLDWLRKHQGHADRCLWATAPDVVGDAAATLARSRPMLSKIRELGYKVAFVAQDDLEYLTVPWGDFDVMFVGGTTEWKMGPAAAWLVLRAKARGKEVHFGRVNSLKRLRYARSLGCETADGTYIAFGPEKNLGRMSRWLKMLDDEPPAPPDDITIDPEWEQD